MEYIIKSIVEDKYLKETLDGFVLVDKQEAIKQPYYETDIKNAMARSREYFKFSNLKLQKEKIA